MIGTRRSLLAPKIAPSWTLGASVALDFANGRYYGTPLASALTVSRGSIGYAEDASGVVIGPFSNNILRQTNQGILREPARTNVVLWNRDLTNAAWTKSNATVALDQTGADLAATSASSITATANNATVLQAITLASSARFQSAYIKRITGTGAISMTTDGGATWVVIPSVYTGWKRLSIPTQTLANPSVGFNIATSGDKIAVDFVQNENGTYWTSPTLTTTVAFARSADSLTFAGAAATLLIATAGTAVVEAAPSSNPSGNVVLLQSNVGDFMAYYNATQLFSFQTAGSDTAAITYPPNYKDSIFRAAIAFDGTGRAVTAGGETPGTSAVAFSARASVTMPWVGYVRGVYLWGSRLSTANIKTLTDFSSGQSFYTDFGAAVDGDGSQAAPWNALSHANAWVNNLLGRTLYLAKGSSARTSLNLTGCRRISVAAYGSGAMPKIDGSNLIGSGTWTLDSGSLYYITGETGDHRIYIDGVGLWSADTKAHVTAGAQFYESGTGRIYVQTPASDNPATHTAEISTRNTMSFDIGISSVPISNISVDGIWVAKSDGNGINVYNANANVTVKNCLIDGAGSYFNVQIDDASGIDVHGVSSGSPATNVLVFSNEVKGVYNASVQFHYVTGGSIYLNNIHDNAQGVEYWTNVVSVDCYQNSIKNIYQGVPANQIFAGHGNALWQANSGADSAHNNNRFFSNICDTIYADGFDIDAGLSLSVFNNVINNAGNGTGRAMFQMQKAGANNTSVLLHNNIFVMPGGASLDFIRVGATATLTADNNDYYTASGSPTWTYNGTGYTSLAAFVAASSSDVHAITGNPLFVTPGSDWHLQGGSPAKNTGTAAHVAPFDYAGSAFGSPPNMGAYA